jgi:hypothetical protein
MQDGAQLRTAPHAALPGFRLGRRRGGVAAGRTNSNAGFGGRCAGEPDARDESAPSSGDTDFLAVAIMGWKEWNAGWGSG